MTRGTEVFSRAEWALLLVLFAVQFCNILDFVIMMPLAPRLRAELALTPRQFSWALSSYGLVGVLGSLGGALALDRFGRRRALLAILAGFVLGTFACGVATTFAGLLAARAATGLFAGVLGTIAMAIVGDAFAGPRRGRAMGVVMSGFATASVVGVPLGLELARWGGRGAPFVAIGVVATFAWLAAWRTLPALRDHLQGGPRTNLLGLLGRPAVRSAFLFIACVVGAGFLVIPFLADALVKNNGLAEADLKWIYLTGGLATLVSTNAIGWAADRYGKAPVFRGAAVAAAAMSIVFTNLPVLPFAILLLVGAAFMVATSGRMVPAQALVVGCVPPAERGTFLSLLTALQHGTMGLASLAAGGLVTATPEGGLQGFALVGAFSALLGVASVFLVGRVPTAG